MSDPEIVALREVIARRVRSDDIAQRRRDIDARGLAYALAADVTVEPVTANGVKSEWTTTPDADRSRAVLYLHGGGYVIGSLDSHRHLVAEIGRAARARSLAIDYRLAPEHPVPGRGRRRRSPPTASCWRAASRPAASPSPVIQPAAGWSSRRCWRSATPDCRSRPAAGRSRHGSTWRRSATA